MVSLGPAPKFVESGRRLLKGVLDMSLWYGISKERERKIRTAVEAEVKKRIVEEITPVIRKQAEQDVRDKAYRDARKDLENEARSATPDQRETNAFREFVKEVEVDCHAQAAVASAEADRVERSLLRSRRWRNFLAYLLLLGLGPAGYEAYARLGLSVAAAVAVGTMALTLLVLALTNKSRHARMSNHVKSRRKVASDYLVVAERAKAYRLIHAERLETKDELDKLADSLQDRKEFLDERYWPKVEDLNAARDSVRYRIEDQARRPFEDFDERLEEAVESESQAREGRA